MHTRLLSTGGFCPALLFKLSQVSMQMYNTCTTLSLECYVIWRDCLVLSQQVVCSLVWVGIVRLLTTSLDLQMVNSVECLLTSGPSFLEVGVDYPHIDHESLQQILPCLQHIRTHWELAAR